MMADGVNKICQQVKYHHDKPFMIAMQDGLEKPYNFHM